MTKKKKMRPGKNGAQHIIQTTLASNNTAPRRRQLFSFKKVSREAGGAAESKPSWREFFTPHPAAEVFRKMTTDSQLRKLAQDIEANGLKIPIQVRNVTGDTTDYIIDGVSRLDAMETELGWQIVDAKGDWAGKLYDIPGRKVQWCGGYTHERIVAEVASYNEHRRHLNESQRGIAAAELAELLASYLSNDKKLQHPAHRPSKGITEAVEQTAKKMNVGVATVHRARKVLKRAPDKIEAIKTGKLSVAKAERETKHRKATKPTKPLTFEALVSKKFDLWLNRNWTMGKHRDVRFRLVTRWLSRYDPKTDSAIAPVSVTYPDNKVAKISDIISGQRT